MNTYPIIDKVSGHVHAFEIANAYLGIGTVAHLLAKIEGVFDVRTRKMFSKSGDIRAEFKCQGKDCVVVEPFGDNSRYWLGVKNAENIRIDFCKKMEEGFKQYRPALVRNILGGILPLRMFSASWGRLTETITA